MMGFHVVLGISVVALNGIAGVRWLIVKEPGEGDAALAGFALGTLVLQLATGFFLITATSEGPGVVHYALPFAGLLAALGARAVHGPSRNRAIAAASLFVATVSVVAYLTGVANG